MTDRTDITRWNLWDRLVSAVGVREARSLARVSGSQAKALTERTGAVSDILAARIRVALDEAEAVQVSPAVDAVALAAATVESADLEGRDRYLDHMERALGRRNWRQILRLTSQAASPASVCVRLGWSERHWFMVQRGLVGMTPEERCELCVLVAEVVTRFARPAVRMPAHVAAWQERTA